MTKKVIKVKNTVSDQELIRMIKEYTEEGYKVLVDAKCKSKGYVELILK